MKADLAEPRRLCLSWQPPSTDAAAPLAMWVKRFKQRLLVQRKDKQHRPLELIDMREPTRDKARLRDGSWTDFVALATIDYCGDCIERGADSELADALRLHRECGLVMWLLRMETGDPAEWYIGDDRTLLDPQIAWTVLPDLKQEMPLITVPPTAVDENMHRHAINPVRSYNRDA